MSVKIKKTIIILTAAILFCGTMILGVFLSGNISKVFGAFGNEEATTEEMQTQQQTEPVIERTKTEKPVKIRGVWFTAGTDYLTDAAGSFDVIKTEIEMKIADIKAMGFNTIFLDYESVAAPRIFAGNGDGSSIFSHCLAYARSIGLYTVTAVPLNEYISAEADYSFNKDAATEFVAAYDTDAVILSGIGKIEEMFANLIAEEKNKIITQSIVAFTENAHLFDEKLLFITAVDGTSPALPDLAKNIFTGTDNILFVENKMSGTDKSAQYKNTLDILEKSAKDSGGNYISGLWTDQTSLIENPLGKTDVTNQISVAESYDCCFGTAVRSYSLLKNDTTGWSEAFLGYLKNLNMENVEKEFVIINHKTTEISTDESKISFTGNCSPGFPLTCNDKNIDITGTGDFSIELELKIGINTVVFKQNGKVYTYNVTYKVDILKAVSPTGKISAPGGTVVEISAVALKNAEVSATINKTKVKLIQGKTLDYGNEEKAPETSSDFVTYSGVFTLPAGKSSVQNLGTISVQAKYNGLSKSISGAKVSVAAKPPETTTAAVTQPETTGTSGETTEPFSSTEPQGPQLTPYNYAGVPGMSRMCEIATQYCEAMPISPLNDLSYPLTTPFLTGMFDYIDGESSYQEFTYYNLRSGKRVYRKDVKMIDSGYNLPTNKISVISSATNGATDINLSTLWKVPVNAVVKGQNYAQTYNSRDFGVWSFTGNCIELAFSYTDEATGTVNVSGSNTISSAEWSRNSSRNEMILRLYFKKAGVFYGYSISYNSDGSLKISIKNKPSSSLAGYRIMLDAGHGGKDVGAICSSTTPPNMKYEKQINLALALKIKEKLESQGAAVILTRTDDSYVSLDDRRNLMYEKKPDMNISIHCDASESASAVGTSAYYYYAQSFPLADAIHKQIYACFSNNFYTTSDRHSVFYPFRVTRTEACPSILVEYGFISNLNECRTLQNDDNQNKLAEATVTGIVDYINSN